MVPDSANHDASQAGSRDRTQATNKKADGTSNLATTDNIAKYIGQPHGVKRITVHLVAKQFKKPRRGKCKRSQSN